MKKIMTALIAVFSVAPLLSHAQWLGTNPVYFNAGNVGIGTSSPTSYLHISGVDAAPGSSGSAQNSSLRVGAITTNLILDMGVSAAAAPYSWLQSRAQNTYATNYPLVLNPNGANVGIGTTDPSGKLTIYDNTSSPNLLHVIKDSYYDEIGLYNYSNTDYYRTDVSFRRARGTAASPAATQTGDWIGALNFWATNSGATFSNPAASIVSIVDGTPGAAYIPGRIVFQTSNGLATTVDRMTLNHNGYLGINTTNPGHYLEVNGDGFFNGPVTSGLAGTTTGAYNLAGGTSGTITIQPQAAAGTYNFNLPTTAGTAGQVLTSAGGGSSAMTWSNVATNPMTTTGDIVYGGASGAPTRLAGNTTSDKLFLTSTGSGGVATAPAYFDLFGSNNTWSGNQKFTSTPIFDSPLNIRNSYGIVFLNSTTFSNYVILVPNTMSTTRSQHMVDADGVLAVINANAPSSSTATGVVGEVRVTSSYIYTCVATNTWVRAAVSTF